MVSVTAEAVRDRRRRFAAPGGSHDRLIGILNKVLPAGVGLIAAVMLLAPLKPRGEVSFLLDRHKVAVTGNRIDVDRAMYRGTDDDGRLFEVTAGRALQASIDAPVIGMQNLVAKLQLQDGPALVQAPVADYNYKVDNITSQQPLTFTGTGGYKMTMRNVTVDLKKHVANGAGGVQGTLPAGTFTADRVNADLGGRTVALDGRAHMRMTPGKMTVPK